MAEAKQQKDTSVPATTGRRRGDGLALLDSLQSDLARLWDQRWPLIPRSLLRPIGRLAELPAEWAPRVDVFEKNGDIVVKAELPGVKKEDVKLTVDQGDLVIEGERRAEQEVKEKDYYRMERSFGSFYRRLPIPEDVKVEQVKARFSDGVLEIHFPKPAEAASKGNTIAIA